MSVVSEHSESTAEPTRQVPVFSPRFDIVETDSELRLYGDLPGVRQEDLDIRYEDDQLLIHGKVVDRNQGRRFVREEYGVGDFRRGFAVGESIDAEQISAELSNGVLIIRLPKTAAAKPRRIKVETV